MGDLQWLKELFLRPLWFHFLGVELSRWILSWFFFRNWHNWLQPSAAQCLCQGGAGLDGALISFGVSVCDSQNIDLRISTQIQPLPGVWKLLWASLTCWKFWFFSPGYLLEMACCPPTWRRGPAIAPANTHPHPKVLIRWPHHPQTKEMFFPGWFVITTLDFSNRQM